METYFEKFLRPYRIPMRVPFHFAQPATARAGEVGRWLFRFTLCEDVAPNEKMWLWVQGGRSNRGLFTGKMQSDHPEEKNYIALSCQNGECLPLTMPGGGRMIFYAPDRGFRAGDELMLDLGGKAGITAPVFSIRNKFIAIMRDPGRDEQIEKLSRGITFVYPGTEDSFIVFSGKTQEAVIGACLLNVTGSTTDRLVLHAPSRAAQGDEIELLLRPEDRYRNVSCDEPGELAFTLDGETLAYERLAVDRSACCRIRVRIERSGVARIRVQDLSNGLCAESNPIVVSQAKPGQQLLWGMIHCHTEYSDGTGTVHGSLTQMRDESRLDFGAVSDHNERWETTEEMWQRTCDAVKEIDEPGRFTTLPGFEYGIWDPYTGDGDRNVYYYKDYGPIYIDHRNSSAGVERLFETIANEYALMIPHHTAIMAQPCYWRKHVPEKERLVELYSSWGNSERSVNQGNIYPVFSWEAREPDEGCADTEAQGGFVQTGLALGWRVGFTSGGDDHQGHGGDNILCGGEMQYTAGLFAVYADENNRDALWNGLWNRRCVATTGARIYIDFTVCGQPMGSEIHTQGMPSAALRRELHIEVHGTAPIARVEIVRNNIDVYTVEPDAMDAEINWADCESLDAVNLSPAQWCAVPFSFYYVRVTQSDRQMGWASPVWLD